MMSSTQSMSLWFAPSTTSDWSSADIDAEFSPEGSAPDPSPCNSACTTGKRRRATWHPTTDIEAMAKSSFTCCKTLKCLDYFVSDQPGTKTLREQQRNFSGLSTLSARTDFVRHQVPFVRQTRSQTGIDVRRGQASTQKVLLTRIRCIHEHNREFEAKSPIVSHPNQVRLPELIIGTAYSWWWLFWYSGYPDIRRKS